MHWIAPTEKDSATVSPEERLWEAADQFRANSGLTAAQYSHPVLGLIFLRFAEVRFAAQRGTLEKAGGSSRRGSRVDDPAAYHADGILYLSPEARFDFLLALPEAADIGARVNAAMREIEKHNPQLAGVLPRTYNLFTSTPLEEPLKKVSEIPAVDYDAFGRIYEYFLGEFARTEGQKGGEFYTPGSIVRLLTEVIEPFHGRILDPACGSGGMFVQSARFVAEHRRNPAAELAICGVEKTDETGRPRERKGFVNSRRPQAFRSEERCRFCAISSRRPGSTGMRGCRSSCGSKISASRCRTSMTSSTTSTPASSRKGWSGWTKCCGRRSCPACFPTCSPPASPSTRARWW